MASSNFGCRVLNILLMFAFVMHSMQVPSPEFLKLWASYETDCQKETGIDPAYAKKVWDSNHFPNNDTKLNCYYKCISLKAGTLTTAGEVVDDVLQKISAEFLDDSATETEIKQECGGIEGTDLCATALKLMVCVKAAILD